MATIAGSGSGLQLAADAPFEWPSGAFNDELATGSLSQWKRDADAVLKRFFDILIAASGLIVAAVPLIIAFAAIKLSSPGPVLYAQPRCGRGGRLFRCWKLRTMVADADRYLTERPQLRYAFEESWKFRADPRVTRAGSFLRRTSLDEIPQLWNVLRGEMSIVGPRPVVPAELLMMYGDDAPRLLSVLPGLTGLWQVQGRSALSYSERVRLDLSYVRTRSLLVDFLILSRTPGAVLTGKGAV